MSSVGQSAFQMCGKAVARHDIEADAGQECDALRLRFGVPRGESLEDVNFAGDVEVVNAIAETGSAIGLDVAENGPATQSTTETSLIAASIRFGSRRSNARETIPSVEGGQGRQCITFRTSQP